MSWSSIVGDHHTNRMMNTPINKTNNINNIQPKPSSNLLETTPAQQDKAKKVFEETHAPTAQPKEEKPFTAPRYSKEKKANLQNKYKAQATPNTHTVASPQIANGKLQQISQVAIEAIRFSQCSINCIFKDKNGRDQPLEDLKALMLKGFDKNYALEVVEMPDGTLTSYDNRRLHLAKQILKTTPAYTIWVKVHKHNDLAPENTREYAQNLFKKDWGHAFGTGEGETQAVLPDTWGQLIAIRVAGDYNSNSYKYTPFGYTKNPRVNTQ